MPAKRPTKGLYLVKCTGAPVTLGKSNVNLPVEHYAILDVGNRLGLDGIDPKRPVIIHQTPPRVRIDLHGWQGDKWTIVARVMDEAAAKERLKTALEKPDYNLGDNNCEHFARFVANGDRQSTQLVGYAISGGVTLLLFGAVN